MLVGHRQASELLLIRFKDSGLCTQGGRLPTCIIRHLGGAAALLEKYDEAKKSLVEAKVLLNKINEISTEYHDLKYLGIVNSAYEEYSEASVLLDLVTKGRFISYEKVQAPRIPYVLGLADVIGELRRISLDSLRQKDITRAEESLDQMVTIYSELTKLDEINFLIPGLRRKCDVARRVIEATRGDITVIIGKIRLENSINELKKILDNKR